MSKTMRAISVMHPWAWLIAQELKPVETREWEIPGPNFSRARGAIGERLALHASKNLDRGGLEFLRRLGVRQLDGARFEAGVIATFELLDAREMRAEDAIGAVSLQLEPWARAYLARNYQVDGKTALVVGAVRRLARVVPCNGALGFWWLPTDVHRMVVDLGG